MLLTHLLSALTHLATGLVYVLAFLLALMTLGAARDAFSSSQKRPLRVGGSSSSSSSSTTATATTSSSSSSSLEPATSSSFGHRSIGARALSVSPEESARIRSAADRLAAVSRGRLFGHGGSENDTHSSSGPPTPSAVPDNRNLTNTITNTSKEQPQNSNNNFPLSSRRGGFPDASTALVRGKVFKTSSVYGSNLGSDGITNDGVNTSSSDLSSNIMRLPTHSPESEGHSSAPSWEHDEHDSREHDRWEQDSSSAPHRRADDSPSTGYSRNSNNYVKAIVSSSSSLPPSSSLSLSSASNASAQTAVESRPTNVGLMNMYRKPRNNQSMDTSESVGLPKGSIRDGNECAPDDEQRDRHEFNTLTRNGTFLVARHSRTNSSVKTDRSSPDHIPSPHSALESRRVGSSLRFSIEKGLATDAVSDGGLDSISKDDFTRKHFRVNDGASGGGGSAGSVGSFRSPGSPGSVGITSEEPLFDRRVEDLHVHKVRSMQSIYGFCARVGVLVTCVFATFLAGSLVYLQNHPKILHQLRAASHNQSGWFSMNVTAVSDGLHAEYQKFSIPKIEFLFGDTKRAPKPSVYRRDEDKNSDNKHKTRKRTKLFWWSSSAEVVHTKLENVPPTLVGTAPNEQHLANAITMNSTWTLRQGLNVCSVVWHQGIDFLRRQAILIWTHLTKFVQWAKIRAAGFSGSVSARFAETRAAVFWKDVSGTWVRVFIVVLVVLTTGLSYFIFVCAHRSTTKTTLTGEISDRDKRNGENTNISTSDSDKSANDHVNKVSNTKENSVKETVDGNSLSTTDMAGSHTASERNLARAEENTLSTSAENLPGSPPPTKSEPRVLDLNPPALSSSYLSPSNASVAGGSGGGNNCSGGDAGKDVPFLKSNNMLSALRAVRHHMKTPEKKKTFSQMVFVHMEEDGIEEWTSDGLRLLAMLEPPLDESFSPQRLHPQHSSSQNPRNGQEGSPPTYSAEEEVFASMAAEAGEEYEYGSGGSNYVLRGVQLSDLSEGMDTTTGSMSITENSKDDWHFAAADHTLADMSVSLIWPQSPELTPSDERNSITPGRSTNVSASLGAIGSASDGATAGVADDPGSSNPSTHRSAKLSKRGGVRSRLSRTSLSVVVPSDDNLDTSPMQPPYSSDDPVYNSKRGGGSKTPKTASNHGGPIVPGSSDHAVPNHPNSADQRKQRLTRHSFRFPSPDGHQERSVNALTLSPFGTPGTPKRHRRFSSRSNASVDGNNTTNRSGREHVTPAEPSNSGPKTMTAFESSQLKLNRSAAKSPREQNRSFHQDFAIAHNTDDGGNDKFETHHGDVARTGASDAAYMSVRKTPARDGTDLGATFPLGTPGVVPVTSRRKSGKANESPGSPRYLLQAKAAEHENDSGNIRASRSRHEVSQSRSSFGSNEQQHYKTRSEFENGDDAIGGQGSRGGDEVGYSEKNDEDEIFNGTGSRHALRKMSQRKGRSSPDLHGFSRVAASVFDDDPFFNDEDPGGSDFSDDEAESWGRRESGEFGRAW